MRRALLLLPSLGFLSRVSAMLRLLFLGFAVLLALAALAGAAVAARHVYLQNLPPDQVPECGPGLDYMLDVFPLGETLSMVFTGSGECAEVTWRFLGLSMPTWVLIWFIGMGVVGFARNWTGGRSA